MKQPYQRIHGPIFFPSFFPHLFVPGTSWQMLSGLRDHLGRKGRIHLEAAAASAATGDDWEDGPQKIVYIGEKNYRNSRFK